MKERTWYIAEPGSLMRGPFSTAQVRAERERGLPERTLLLAAGEEPIFAHDSDGFAILERGGSLQEIPSVISLPHVTASVFCPENEFVTASTRDLDPLRERLVGTSAGTEPSRSENGAKTFVLERILRKLGHFFSGGGLRTLLVLCGLFTSMSISKEGDDRLDAQTESQGRGLRLNALAPTPLRALDAVVEAKLARDTKKYARALVYAEASRPFLPPEQLPSSAWTAALAMVTLPSDELDASPSWRRLLERLGKDTRQGIAVLAYEVSRIETIFHRFLFRARENGVRGEGAVPQASRTASLWNLKVTAKGEKISQADWEEVAVSLERIERAFDSVEVPDRVLRGRLVARALWAATPLSGAAEKVVAAAARERMTLLGRKLAERLPMPDRRLVEVALDEMVSSAKPQVARRWDEVATLQKKVGFLCNPLETALGAEFLLQTLSLSGGKAMPSKLFESVLDECFVGSLAFVPTFPAQSFETRNLPLALYMPAGTPSIAARTLFSPSSSVRGDVLSQKGFGPQGAIWAWSAFSGVLPATPSLDFDRFRGFCQKGVLSERVCLNFRWHYSAYADEKARLLSVLSEVFTMREVRAAALGLAADLAVGRVAPSQDVRDLEVAAHVRQEVRRFLDADHPENAALEWFAANHADLAP